MAAILVTGAAGFIGAAAAAALLDRGERVIGMDNVNAYYDPSLKRARLAALEVRGGDFRFIRADAADAAAMDEIFAAFPIDRVLHLAAQAGVRYSLTAPQAYVSSNLAGFVNVVEGCRKAGVDHFVYASSSSVYGGAAKQPFSTADRSDEPLSLYGATKKANELIAYAYCHLYGLPMTGLRFFTVYGPWGRPDMACFLFARRMFADAPIELFNNGDHDRDFTYIEDGVKMILSALDGPPVRGDGGETGSALPYRIYNVGGGARSTLRDLIAALERATGRSARLVLRPMQAGDAVSTLSDKRDRPPGTEALEATPLIEGVERFVSWYRDYYGVD